MSKQHPEENHHGQLDESDPAQTRKTKAIVIAQLTDAMRAQSLSKARLAQMLKTSRSQVDRLLDPSCDITLSSLQRAAALLGRKVQIELV